MHRLAFAALTTALSLTALLTTTEAVARLTIRDGSPPEYTLEIEPHLDVEGLDADGSLFGLGAGGRYRLSQGMTLTIRVGVPVLASVGLSFF
jgi:hypothetical protein